jgi:phosphoenolpyruvate carboxykinase (ATP)
MYQFVTGFTSKVAGTEVGITEPVPTFSTLFGEPFMPLKAQVYADMLGERIEKYNTKVYLVNTGWVTGPAVDPKTGEKNKRMKLSYTRDMITAALNDAFEKEGVTFEHNDLFNLDVPTSVPNSDVPTEIMNPRNLWADKAAYDEQALKLAKLFQKNFEEKYPDMPAEIKNAGPRA